MKCECGGRIKKGVDYRISEIADFKKAQSPSYRPPYVHLMPLAELISKVLDKGVTTKTVQNKWQILIDRFGSEINVLIDAPIGDIEKIDFKISQIIESFRNNSINVIPGGGGKYGEIDFEAENDVKKAPKVITLDNF